MIVEFTDTDFAVIADSLLITRDKIRDEGRETPNIDAAIAKLHSWATPAGCQFIAISGEDDVAIATAAVEAPR